MGFTVFTIDIFQLHDLKPLLTPINKSLRPKEHSHTHTHARSHVPNNRRTRAPVHLSIWLRNIKTNAYTYNMSPKRRPHAAVPFYTRQPFVYCYKLIRLACSRARIIRINVNITRGTHSTDLPSMRARARASARIRTRACARTMRTIEDLYVVYLDARCSTFTPSCTAPGHPPIAIQTCHY